MESQYPEYPKEFTSKLRLRSLLVELGEEFELPLGSQVVSVTPMPSGERFLVFYTVDLIAATLGA